ncbi:hypothetical protein [Alteromonas australica]|uniref:hypothetical protein n=1 Tax=Alteromonas australica TaxID=589873 RepID=UPI000C8F932E|nr:hypothetical protein [Alteromonas australica]MAD45497.1 hypothetical protein [Oceanospirillaceae bacterium]|tara:strand:- start:5774 stop:6256 length:483 start_codon:yes stop_codon:yes gene_type:complete
MKHTNVIAITVVIVLSFVVFSFLSVKKSANSDTNSDKAPPTSEVLATEDVSVSASSQRSNSASLETRANIDAAKIGLETNPELLAEIERDMQFSEAPEGDVSYLSPEAETPQKLEEDFPGVAADPNMTMPGNMLPEDINMYDDIGEPLEKNTKMDDLLLK